MVKQGNIVACLVLGKRVGGVWIWKGGRCLARGIEGWKRA